MIESLHSPHIARVKALIGARGKIERKATGLFVAEGAQFAREVLDNPSQLPIETLYLTQNGRARIESIGNFSHLNIVDVSEAVMQEMSDTVTPQGILAICKKSQVSINDLALTGKSRFIYLYEIQDPGNAGTILRSADAMGMSAVITSPNSVDMFAPKVIRSSAGSLWHIPVIENASIKDIFLRWPSLKAFALDANAAINLSEIDTDSDVLAIFGNEARGLDSRELSQRVVGVKIPMPGNAESLNLSAAASILMYHFANIPTAR